jgi:hypothetical protein
MATITKSKHPSNHKRDSCADCYQVAAGRGFGSRMQGEESYLLRAQTTRIMPSLKELLPLKLQDYLIPRSQTQVFRQNKMKVRRNERMSARTPLSNEEIDAIKVRCKSASRGPWKSFVEGRDMLSGSDFIQTGGEDIYLSGATVADQDFMAHARQDIPNLIGEIERLKALLATKK